MSSEVAAAAGGWTMPARPSQIETHAPAAVPPRFAIVEDDDWVDDAIRRIEICSTQASSAPSGLHSRAPVRQPAPAATPTSLPEPKRASAYRKRRLEHTTARALHADIVASTPFSCRVTRESTERLRRYKFQLDRLDRLNPSALLTLPANFGPANIRALLAGINETADATLREKSMMDGAHNLIFHKVCSEAKMTRNATVDEVVDHLDRIAALPVDDQAKIGCYLDVTRTLLSTAKLGSTFESVRRAIAARPAFSELPVYR